MVYFAGVIVALPTFGYVDHGWCLCWPPSIRMVNILMHMIVLWRDGYQTISGYNGSRKEKRNQSDLCSLQQRPMNLLACIHPLATLAKYVTIAF